jgi:hypothetical protein
MSEFVCIISSVGLWDGTEAMACLVTVSIFRTQTLVFKYHSPINGGSWEKWLILGSGKEENKMNLKVAPRNKFLPQTKEWGI